MPSFFYSVFFLSWHVVSFLSFHAFHFFSAHFFPTQRIPTSKLVPIVISYSPVLFSKFPPQRVPSATWHKHRNFDQSKAVNGKLEAEHRISLQSPSFKEPWKILHRVGVIADAIWPVLAKDGWIIFKFSVWGLDLDTGKPCNVAKI